jgi:methylphosphotriester-DNA--protein-cysteine methyltransferase
MYKLEDLPMLATFQAHTFLFHSQITEFMDHFQSTSARWNAVVSRDPNSDGHFVYCVKTTGIYCRPICKARLARRANVEFHKNSSDAQAAGYRACKRCKPELNEFKPHSAAIAKARRTIEKAGPRSRPTLKDLAAEAELSEWHFHRIFKEATGVTPKAYAKDVNKTRTTPATSAESSTPQLTFSTGSPVSDSGQYSSTFFTTAPDFQAMLPFDVEMPADENFAELLEMPWKSTEPTEPIFDAVNTFSDDRSALSQLAKEIQYTIQPWEATLVLIASTADGICALDTGLSEPELLATLHSLFPLSKISLSDWDGSNSTESSNMLHRTFATVMQALVNPSGKILHLPFDVGL